MLVPGHTRVIGYFYTLQNGHDNKLPSVTIKGWRSEVKLLSRVRLFETPWTVAYQAPQSMEFSRQEYWSGLPLPSPGDLPNPGIKPRSPALQADALPSDPPGKHHTRIWHHYWLFMLRIPSLWLIYFVTEGLYLLVPLIYFTYNSATSLSSGNHVFMFCIYDFISLFCLFICSFFFFDFIT